jgi:hypothetical protein
MTLYMADQLAEEQIGMRLGLMKGMSWNITCSGERGKLSDTLQGLSLLMKTEAGQGKMLR